MTLVLIDSDAEETFGEPNRTGTPERNLILAILERAILDFVGNDEKEARLAEDWIFGHLKTETPEEFSFAWICHHLDLDKGKISGIIRAMPKRGDRRIAPWYFMKQSDAKKASQPMKRVRGKNAIQ